MCKIKNGSGAMNEERKRIRYYLQRYRYCINRKKELETRLYEIKAEMQYPLSAVSYSGSNGQSFNISTGAAAFTYRIAEIEDRIEEQQRKSVSELLAIMEVLDFLPVESVEREIIEKRFVDRMTWYKISNKMHMSRSRIAFYEKQGLDKLMTYKRVQELVNDFWENRFEII